MNMDSTYAARLRSQYKNELNNIKIKDFQLLNLQRGVN